MIFGNDIINELKKVATDAPEDEADKYDLDDEEPEDIEDTDYTLDDEEPEEDTEDNDYTLEEDEEPVEDTDDEEDTNDYDLDDNLDDEEQDTTDDEEPVEDTDEELTDDSEDEDEDSLEAMEKKLFEDLTSQEFMIKDKELKSNFLDLYNNIIEIVNKLDGVIKTSMNENVLFFVNKKLFELRGIVYDYINNTYKLKTYLENQKNYMLYIAVLNNINGLLIQIEPKENV